MVSVCDFPLGLAVEGLKALPLTSDGFPWSKADVKDSKGEGKINAKATGQIALLGHC